MNNLIFRWRDPRLRYYDQPDHNKILTGESWFADRIWTPNVFIENEVSSEVMSSIRDSVQVTITPFGNPFICVASIEVHNYASIMYFDLKTYIEMKLFI